MIEELLDCGLKDIEMEAWGVRGTCVLSSHPPYIAAACGGRTASHRWKYQCKSSWRTHRGALPHAHDGLFLHHPGVAKMLACWWSRFINIIININIKTGVIYSHIVKNTPKKGRNRGINNNITL